MTDQLGLFDRPGDDETGELDLAELRAALTNPSVSPGPQRRVQRRQQRSVRQAAARRRKRRVSHSLLALLVLVVIAAGVVVGLRIWRKDAAVVPDFAGGGTSETVVRVQSGDSLTDIADTLASDGVVASTQSFVAAAADNADVKKIKTGYYKVKLHASAASAIASMTAPTARVGQLRLIPGRQLADVSSKTGAGSSAVTDGYITEITKAACVPLNGVSNCFTAAQLWQAEETADPVTQLGVVSWAVTAVGRAPDPKKRLEGMLVPGDYDIAPNAGALQTLQTVVSASATNWNATDIVAGAKALNRTPYDVAVAASLAEREGTTANMSKVTRVIYNRLDQKMKLQLDSTVDYALGHAQVATTATERANPSPYNTYFAAGLPPTPITSPGSTALDAALNPDDGNWLFFVQIDKQQNFCFSATYAEHLKCVAKARANGVFGG